MINIVREAQERFQEIQNLLDKKSAQNNDFFTHLSVATEEAYVLMNEGMCANTSVCHECAEHRDFIRSMMDVLGELEINATAENTYIDKLAEYSERVNKILKNLGTVLTS